MMLFWRRVCTTALLSMAISLPLSVYATASVPSSTASISNASGTQPSLFFIQTANKMTLQPGKLTLHDFNHQTLWFADAPSRTYGYFNLSQYLGLWRNPKAAFLLNNPNATLVGYMMNPKTHKEERLTVVLVLRFAHRSDDAKDLIYTVQKTYLVPERKAINQTVTLSHPTLLVDSYQYTSLGGYTTTPQ